METSSYKNRKHVFFFFSSKLSILNFTDQAIYTYIYRKHMFPYSLCIDLIVSYIAGKWSYCLMNQLWLNNQFRFAWPHAWKKNLSWYWEKFFPLASDVGNSFHLFLESNFTKKRGWGGCFPCRQNTRKVENKTMPTHVYL